ncbi:MAG: hypothetical protein CL872_00150 [Dehalococcoidaceae bacterium]|nr:hypothetical protein [Dehalococcoidaceae bacterium]|tara:strand:+ start:263 stop:670 length:408 start_codon:yes stop_codon:yes gene_type:complete
MNSDSQDIFNTSFGSLLQEARKARGLSLIQVYEETRINTIYLEALEAEQLEIFPAYVLAKSFLRLYAEFLEIDFVALSNTFPKDINRPLDLEPLPNLEKSKVELFYEDFLAIEQRVYFVGILAILFIASYFLFLY